MPGIPGIHVPACLAECHVNPKSSSTLRLRELLDANLYAMQACEPGHAPNSTVFRMFLANERWLRV